MSYLKRIVHFPNIRLWYFFALFAANIILYYETQLEKDRTIMVGYRYDRKELVKLHTRHYYMQSKYRKLVKDYSLCKQGKE